MPIIHLATLEDLRSITSQNVGEILRVPHLYIPTGEPDVMRSWGVASADTLGIYERLHSGSLVAPAFMGATASRADLEYHGAEPAPAFVSAS